jgi:hypothetical protein
LVSAAEKEMLIFSYAPKKDAPLRNLIKTVLVLFSTFSFGINASPQEWSVLQELGKPTVKISISPAEPTTKDMITFTVDAQDNSMTGLKRIVLLVNDREVKVCLMSPCVFFGGPFPEGLLKCEAKVFDNTSDDPWTGYRKVNVRSRSSSVGGPKRKIDLLPLAENSQTRWTNGHVDLPFPGEEDDIRSFACFRYDAVLEDDQVYAKVLLTRPQSWDEFGSIIGIFKIENLPQKATFKTTIGFLKEVDQTDAAEFKVFVNKDPSFFAAERCFYDGRMDDLVLDLGRYPGQDVEIVLEVHVLTALTRHLAVWVDPRIEW